MRFYLAARYSDHPRMQGVRDVLNAMGHEVTSRWIDCHAGKYPTSFTPAILNSDPSYCAGIAKHDVEDLAAADTLVAFSPDGGGGKGGRHVEFGLALGLRKQVVLVGAREHVFHTLDEVHWYPSWSAFVIGLQSGEL